MRRSTGADPGEGPSLAPDRKGARAPAPGAARRCRRIASGLYALSCLGGCGDPGPDPGEPRHLGEHVVVTSQREVELCGGSLAHMDEFTAALAERFAVLPPLADERLQFHWSSPDEVEQECGARVLGCTLDAGIFSSRLPHDHELVHGVAFALGRTLPFLEEGLAVAHEGLDGDLIDVEFGAEPLDVRSLLTLSRRELGELRGGYDVAGAFTAHLIDRHGLDRVLALYSALAEGSDLAAVEQAFEEVLGAALAQSVAAFEDELRCPHVFHDAKLMECAAPEVPWDGQSLTVRRALACEQDDAVGPFADRIVVLHTLQIPEDGDYALRMAGDDGDVQHHPDLTYGGAPVSGVSLYRCGGCSARNFLTTRVGDGPRVLPLAAGLYALRFHGPASEATTLEFTLRRVPAAGS